MKNNLNKLIRLLESFDDTTFASGMSDEMKKTYHNYIIKSVEKSKRRISLRGDDVWKEYPDNTTFKTNSSKLGNVSI